MTQLAQLKYNEAVRVYIMIKYDACKEYINIALGRAVKNIYLNLRIQLP